MKLKIILLILLFVFSGCASRKNDVPTTKEFTMLRPETKVYKMAKPMPKPEPKPEAKPVMDVDKDGEIDSEDPMPEILMNSMSGKNIEKFIPIKNTPIEIQSINNLPLNINSISKGDINYVVQDTMIVGVINEVNMTISVGVDKEKIISQIKTFTKDNLHTESIRISPVMKARLIDASGGVNFKIVEKSGQEQFLEYGEITIWTWEVTPLTKGNNNLSLVVDVTLNDKSKTIQVYDGVIYVYSNKTLIGNILSFLSKNWQYILSTLLLPFGIYLYNIYSKRKKDNKVE